MKYELKEEVLKLVADKTVSCRRHPSLPLSIFNYTAKAQQLKQSEWTTALKDCRGLILDDEWNIVGRPFSKFFNYSQVLDKIPANEPFTVWEKLDGSLIIVCSYQGERVVATRGSFESEQAIWAAKWLDRWKPTLYAPKDFTFLMEVIYPENRIVVDYGSRQGLFLLAIQNSAGRNFPKIREFLINHGWIDGAKSYDGITDFSIVNSDPQFQSKEGFVVEWKSGFRCKVKADEYVRLHRLITQCSTRTIWEMLRTGQSTDELLDRVPEDFKQWARTQIGSLLGHHEEVLTLANERFKELAPNHFISSRKEFAERAKTLPNPSLLFSLLDGKDITDQCWKIVEPKWAKPFHNQEEKENG